MDDSKPTSVTPQAQIPDATTPVDPVDPSSPSLIRSLARLAIGGILLSTDEFLRNLTEWETQANKSSPEFGEPPSKDIVTIPVEDESTAEVVRYAVIGLAFDAQDRLQSGFKTLNKATRMVGDLARPFINPLSRSRIFKPIRRQYDELAMRGQREVDSWVERGRTEDVQSRTLTQTALSGAVDSSVSFMATNEDIQELVQSQGVSLAGEIIEEIRERTVSADNFLEAVYRTALRRPSRSELPEPPSEVKEQAMPSRQIRGRIVRK